MHIYIYIYIYIYTVDRQRGQEIERKNHILVSMSCESDFVVIRRRKSHPVDEYGPGGEKL